MSLQSLIDLRISGSVPGAVWLIAGKPPAWFQDTPACVVVNPNEKNHDFRAIVGLHVDVFELDNNECHLPGLYDSILASKPKSAGVASSAGTSGLNDAHTALLKRTLELLNANPQ